MELAKDMPGQGSRCRLSIRWMDTIRRDMKTHCMDDQIADNRKVWSGIVATVGRHTLDCKNEGDNVR